MEGPPDNRGVNYRIIDEIFKIVKSRNSTHTYTLSLSMMEIYNEQLRDLLTNDMNNSGR